MIDSVSGVDCLKPRALCGNRASYPAVLASRERNHRPNSILRAGDRRRCARRGRLPGGTTRRPAPSQSKGHVDLEGKLAQRWQPIPLHQRQRPLQQVQMAAVLVAPAALLLALLPTPPACPLPARKAGSPQSTGWPGPERCAAVYTLGLAWAAAGGVRFQRSVVVHAMRAAAVIGSRHYRLLTSLSTSRPACWCQCQADMAHHCIRLAPGRLLARSLAPIHPSAACMQAGTT
jgi:hypothetical protein